MKRIKPEQIVAWVESNFPDYKTRKNGIELVINNPFDGDTGHHFNINPERGQCHDWRSDNWVGYDKSGKLRPRTFVNFVVKYRNCSISQALTEITGIKYQLQLKRQVVEQIEESTLALPTGSVSIVGSKEPQMALLLSKWLNSRGWTNDDIAAHHLHHYCSDVIWPYYEYEELVYWQSRSRLSKIFRFPPKEVGVVKTDFLYGFDLIEPASILIITESIFDAHTLGDQAVASGGAMLGEKQLNKIRAIGPRDGVILAPDNDSAGVNSIVTNGELLLSRGFKVYYSMPPKLEYDNTYTKDWNDIGRFVTGFGKPVRSIFESNIRRFNRNAMVELTTGNL